MSTLFLGDLSVAEGAEGADGDREGDPEQGKGETDLPEQVEREMRIIPYAKPEFEIDKTAADELDRRNDTAAERGAQDEWLVLHGAVEMKNRGQANTAAERHAPMGMSAAEDLERIVCRAACGEQAELSQGDTDRFGKGVRFFGNRSVHRRPFVLSFFSVVSVFAEKVPINRKKEANFGGIFSYPLVKLHKI